MEKIKLSSKTKTLSLDLEFKILSRLSLKHLYRFKCVCKDWRDLISSQHFLKLHRQHHASRNSEGTILLIGRITGSIFSYDFHADTVTDLTRFASNVPSLATPDKYRRLIGTCNGLLCFEDYTKLYIVYNPLTGACRKITGYVETYFDIVCQKNYLDRIRELYGEEYSICHSPTHLIGFGYDRLSDDYKLFSIHMVWCAVGGEPRTVTLEEECAYTYSFKANSWKVVENALLYRGIHYRRSLLWSNNMALANDALHWLICSCCENHNKCAIASFDIQTEEYREIQAPDGMNTSYDDSRVNLTALESCLHILHSTKDLSRMEVWVMKEYGVELSWTKVFQCSLIDQLDQDLSGNPLLCAYSDDGQELLVALRDKPDIFVRCNLPRQDAWIVQLLSDDQIHKFDILPWKGFLGSPIDD